MNERWLPVVGFEEFYEVSDFGAVRNVLTGYLKRASPIANGGHLQVGLYANGKGTSRLVHRLVLAAFVGPCPDGMQGCHFPDRDPTNNHLSNLRWDTPRANRIDAVKHGVCGPGHSSSKYDHTAIRELRVSGLSKKAIRERTGISKSHLGKILRRWNWRRSGIPL